MTGLRRGHEVHLPDMEGTNLADISLYNTQSDDTNPEIGKYYKTTNNLPWALNFSAGFAYPKETVSLQEAYNYFQEWVLSSGLDYPDWYYDHIGYRDSQYIYQN